MEVKFYPCGSLDNEELKFAIIVCQYRGKFVFVKSKKRQGWEMPAGHREPGENINNTGPRELREETGASKFTIRALYDYCVRDSQSIGYGRLFYANIEEFGNLLDEEIEELRLFDSLPHDLSFPKVQSALFEKVLEEL